MRRDTDDAMEEEAEITNGDLVKFLRQMQVNADKISTEIRKEIKTSNENLEKEIKKGNEHVKAEMKAMNEKVKRVSENVEKLRTDK